MTGRRARVLAPTPALPFCILTVALGLAVALLLPDAIRWAVREPIALFGWAVLLSMANWRAIWAVPRLRIDVTLGTPVAVGAAVVLDPALAMLITLLAISDEHEFQALDRPWMIAFNRLQNALITYVTAVVVHQVVLNPVGDALVGAPLHFALSNVVVAIAAWLLGRIAFREIPATTVSPSAAFNLNFLLVALLSVLVVLLHTRVGWWSLAILVVPMMLGFTALQSAREASERADELADRLRDVEVLHELGAALLSACTPARVAELAEGALRALCGTAGVPARTVVALDGLVEQGLEPYGVPGAVATVGVPSGLDERRSACVGAVCNAVGLALQRLVAEERLRASQRAQAELAEQILAEGAIARSRVALHVHDEVLPFLAAAQIQADNTLHAARIGREAQAADLAEKVRDAVEDGIRTLRDVLDDLQNQTLLPGDLPSWVQRVGEQLRLEHGLDVAVDHSRLHGGIAHPIELLLAESITGLVANVVAHAHARSVRIRLRSTARFAVLDLSDDGVGFDPEAVGATSHGLALLRQRAALVDGRLTIDSGHDEGTRIHLHVPLASTAAPAPALPPQVRVGA